MWICRVEAAGLLPTGLVVGHDQGDLPHREHFVVLAYR